MNRWLLKNKEDFAAWKSADDHIGKTKGELEHVNEPNIYPVVIVWYWYGITWGDRLAYTFVLPRDFEYTVDHTMEEAPKMGCNCAMCESARAAKT
jgi:hypothetical protein